MRKIFSIAWNDIKIEFSERLTLLFFLVLPIVFTTIIGLGLQNLYGGGGSGDDRTPLAVIDQDGGAYATELIHLLSESDVLRIAPEKAEQAAQAYEDREAAALLEIPSGFSQSVLAGQPVELTLHLDPAISAAIAVEQELNGYVSQLGYAVSIAQQSVQAAEQIRPFDSEQEKQTYFDASLDEAKALLADPPTRAVTVMGKEQPATVIATGFEQSSPGQLVTWVLVTLLGASEVFVNERLGGTLRRLLVTPTTKATILIGKIAGRFGMGLLQMTLLVGFGALVLKVNWGSSYPALALILVAFGLAGTSIGVMLGAFARTRGQAGSLSVLFSMLLAALGGAWWPLEITPPYFQTAVKILPSTWAMMGLKDVIIQGEGVMGVLPEAGVLLGFAAVFFTIGVWKLKFE